MPLAHRPSSRTWFTFCLVFVLLPRPVAGSDSATLRRLVNEYGEAKKERAATARTAGRGRGRNQRSQRNQRQRGGARSVEEILVDIAALRDAAALRFLAREYADPDPKIAAACAVAILQSGQENAAKIVIKGFNRGGKWSAYARVTVLDALATSTEEEGLEFVVKMARRGDVETRAIALGSLARRSERKDVLPVVLEALDERPRELRNAALRAVRRFRFKEVVAPLIERLSREKDEKLRVDSLQLLVDLTDVNMGFEVEDWKKWWEVAEARFEFSKKSSGSTRVVTPDLQYFGIEVASKRVAFLVDASNSMLRSVDERRGGRGRRGGGGGGGRRGGQGGGRAGPGGGGERKIDVLKKELTRILRELPADTFINIVYFHQSVVPWKKQLHSLKGGGRGEAISFVQGLTCAWGTNIYDTLELALKDRRVDTIFLLSDGRPVGGKYTEPDDILRNIGAINRVRGAQINCISFGRETVFLKNLAKENGGVYRATGN